MDFTQDRPATNDLDLGQFVPMGRSSIDRYTTIYHLTKWFGYSFSERWWRSMLRQTSLAPFPDAKGILTVVNDLKHLKELDLDVARILAEEMTGRKGPRVFRLVSYKKIRGDWGLRSLFHERHKAA